MPEMFACFTNSALGGNSRVSFNTDSMVWSDIVLLQLSAITAGLNYGVAADLCVMVGASRVMVLQQSPKIVSRVPCGDTPCRSACLSAATDCARGARQQRA